MTTEFTQLGLHPQLVQAVTERGYTEATPIQASVIPVMLTGRDIIGQAQTGTGKTAAFALPILNNLTPKKRHVQALVVAPTRELAMQVSNAMYEYGKLNGVRVLAVYGGTPYGRQISRINKGVDVIVGTPGRMLDLIERDVLKLDKVSTVVLDEADEMLSMGFVEDIESILAATPADRQTALFSATLPNRIQQLAQNYMTEPEIIRIERKQLTVDRIDQRHYMVNQSDKVNALTRLFEMENVESAIIFAKTRVGTAELANTLNGMGFSAESLNGDLSQDARVRVLNRFRGGNIKVLVATDVAARGLDIDGISHVFNFDLPMDPEVYVHRIGRTGRAGASGVAISLITPRENRLLRRIEQYTRQRVIRAELPSISDIQEHREAQLITKMNVWLARGRCRREREMVEAMVEQGHDPIEVAAVALKMARQGEKNRPIPQISRVRPGSERSNQRDRNGRGRGRDYDRRGGHSGRGHNDNRRRDNRKEEGMVRFMVSKGRLAGVRPGDVVGTIAYHANIPGSVLGRINIQDDRTLVDVPQEFVEKVLAKKGSYQIHRQNVEIELA